MVALPNKRTANTAHTPFIITDSGKAIYEDGRYLKTQSFLTYGGFAI